MLRTVGGVVVGAIAWFLSVLVLGFVLREAWPEMAAIRDVTLLTVPMLVARLMVSALSSVAGGYAAGLVGKEAFWVPIGAGVLLLVVFVPYHVTIWSNFPVWYHLTFLVSLPVLSLLGGALAARR
jgi:hypothetical protein